MKKTIITYFEPYRDRETNASKEVVLALDINAQKVSLPVSWKRSLPVLDQIMNEEARYLFMVGEAGNYPETTVELIANNICSGIDVDGVKKDKERILRATPKSFKTNFKIGDLPFTNSNSAGRFLCNYVYYISLLRTEVTKVVFIHVPYLHSKGSRTKEVVTQKVKDIIQYFISNDESLLIRHKNKVLTIDKNNAYYLYPQLQKEHNYPNVIIGIDRKEDGGFIMSGRADGYRGVYYERGTSKEQEREAVKAIYYRILKYQDSLDEEDREDIKRLERTSRFTLNEYTGSEMIVKRYINLFISRANYKDELSFYQSLDYIYEHNLKSVLSIAEENALYEAKDYVSRLGLKQSTELLLRIVKR